MALGDGEAVADFLQRDRGGCFQLLSGHSRAAELPGKRHRETRRVSSRDKLFRIRADAVFEARAEGILRLFENATVGGDRAFAVFKATLPDCRCFALHFAAPFGVYDGFESREFDSPVIEKGILTEPNCRVRQTKSDGTGTGRDFSPPLAAAGGAMGDGAELARPVVCPLAGRHFNVAKGCPLRAGD